MSDKKFLQSDITQEQFLNEFWNKKPFLFKNVYPSAAKLAEPSDLLELATLEEFETRLVYKDQNGKRKLLYGPIHEKDLNNYTEEDFGLICHNLNTLAPEFYELEKLVDFVPKWEFDDVMSVYTNSDMSLGAHIDNYNVFILQGQGKRRWEIQMDPKVSWRDDEEIKVLQEFTPDFSWELEPGDMIYIPPGVAHHGVSLAESVSYSIGFKSLETVDMIGEFMAYQKESFDSTFFSNQNFNANSKSDATTDILKFLQTQASEYLKEGSEFQSWMEKKLSRPKFPIEPVGEEAPSSFNGMELQRDCLLKYALFSEGESRISINEKLYHINQEEIDLLIPMLDSNPFETFTVSEKAQEKLKDILDELYESGSFFIPGED